MDATIINVRVIVLCLYYTGCFRSGGTSGNLSKYIELAVDKHSNSET